MDNVIHPHDAQEFLFSTDLGGKIVDPSQWIYKLATSLIVLNMKLADSTKLEMMPYSNETTDFLHDLCFFVRAG